MLTQCDFVRSSSLSDYHNMYDSREIKIFTRAVYYLLRKFNSPPNLVRDNGIYSTRAGSILTSAGPAWDLGVQLIEHECEDQRMQEWELMGRKNGV